MGCPLHRRQEDGGPCSRCDDYTGPRVSADVALAAVVKMLRERATTFQDGATYAGLADTIERGLWRSYLPTPEAPR